MYFLTKQGIPDTNTGPISFKQAISTNQGAGSAAVFCLSAAVIFPVAALLTYHVRVSSWNGNLFHRFTTMTLINPLWTFSLQLLLLNITTIEQVGISIFVSSPSIPPYAYPDFVYLLHTDETGSITVYSPPNVPPCLLTRKFYAYFRLSRNPAYPFILSIVLLGRLTLQSLTALSFPQIRNQAHKSLVPGPTPPNPFSHGTWRRNLMAVLCRPTGYSWLDASALATEDRRGVNPGSQVAAAAASAARR